MAKARKTTTKPVIEGEVTLPNDALKAKVRTYCKSIHDAQVERQAFTAGLEGKLMGLHDGMAKLFNGVKLQDAKTAEAYVRDGLETVYGKGKVAPATVSEFGLSAYAGMRGFYDDAKSCMDAYCSWADSKGSVKRKKVVNYKRHKLLMGLIRGHIADPVRFPVKVEGFHRVNGTKPDGAENWEPAKVKSGKLLVGAAALPNPAADVIKAAEALTKALKAHAWTGYSATLAEIVEKAKAMQPASVDAGTRGAVDSAPRTEAPFDANSVFKNMTPDQKQALAALLK